MRRHRSRAQGLVEYGLITAVVAIVAMAGLSVLSTAQRNYFQAMDTQPIPADVSGAFSHDTLVDPASCSDPNALLGVPITCIPPVVTDQYVPAVERQAPGGWMGLHLDDQANPLFVCQLAPTATPSRSSCTGPTYDWPSMAPSATSYQWIPTNPALLTPTPNHTLRWWYECHGDLFPCPPSIQKTTNHKSSAGAPWNFQMQTFKFAGAPTCTNLQRPGLPALSVEIGRPISCSISIDDLVPTTPASNFDIGWQVIGASGNGLNTLTCGTPNPGWNAQLATTLYAPSTGNRCSKGDTVHCITGQNGNPAYSCTVVFRRLPNSAYATSPLESGTATIHNTAQRVVTPPTSAIQRTPDLTINIVPQTFSPNPVRTWIRCSAGSGNVTALAPTTNPLTGLGAWKVWQTTPTIQVTGSGGSITCTAYAVDSLFGGTGADGTGCRPPLQGGPDCGTYPDQHDSYPPVGSIKFMLSDGVSVLQVGQCTAVPSGSFQLTTDPSVTSETPNGIPQGASCSGPITFSLPLPPSTTLTAEYDGTAVPFAGAHTNGTNVPVSVSYS